MSCIHCNDTGSLSKDPHGYLDCARCDAAQERAALEGWVRAEAPNCDLIDAWLIYKHGKNVSLTQ